MTEKEAIICDRTDKDSDVGIRYLPVLYMLHSKTRKS